MIEQAFIEFREFYKLQFPASVPTEEKYREVSDLPSWLPYAVLAMFISASLLSGVHTVNTVYSLMETAAALLPLWVYQFVSLLSFIGVELALMLSAYLIVREKIWGWAILTVTFLFAMSANLYSVSKALTADVSKVSVLIHIGPIQINGETVVAVIIGIAAPLMALMAGKIYVQINRTQRALAVRSKTAYQAAMIIFDKEVVDAWKKHMKANGVTNNPVIVSNPNVSKLSNGQMDTSNGQKVLPSKSTAGHSRKPDATAATIAYFQANREALDIPVRQLEGAIGAKRSTISAVKKAIQEGRINLDGQSDTGESGQ